MGEQVECWRKGRLLQHALGHANRELRGGLREAEAWTQHEFEPLDLDLLHSCQSVIRMVAGVALVKIKLFDRLPWMLSRWGEGYIRARALEQYESVPPDQHEPVTLLFLEEGSHLRDIVDNLSESEALNNPIFKSAIDELRIIPLDDSTCESPHARAGRVGSASRRSQWPWIASTVRLNQNFAFCDHPDL